MKNSRRISNFKLLCPVAIVTTMILVSHTSVYGQKKPDCKINASHQCDGDCHVPLYDGDDHQVGEAVCGMTNEKGKTQECACFYRSVDDACAKDDKGKCAGKCKKLYKEKGKKGEVKGKCVEWNEGPGVCNCVYYVLKHEEKHEKKVAR